jgi:hypothetical protein
MCITVSHWLNSMSDLTNDINPNICFYSNKLLQSQTTHYNHTTQLVFSETVPKLELPVQVRENGHSNPSSGSGTAVSTPNNDSSIEILSDNCEVSVNNFYN